MLKISFLSLGLIAALSLQGCASMGKGSSGEELKKAVEGYNHAFRWKNYDLAASYLDRNIRRAFIEAYEEDEESLQIDDFQIVAVDMESPSEATVVVRVRYMLLPSVVLEKRRMIQTWIENEDKEWRLEQEKNSIRELDPELIRHPSDGAPTVEPEQEGAQTEVETTRPGQEEVSED